MIEQLTEQTLLCELHTQIAATTETENELKAEIIKAEATEILDKISQIKRRINLHTLPTIRPLDMSATEFAPSEPVPRR